MKYARHIFSRRIKVLFIIATAITLFPQLGSVAVAQLVGRPDRGFKAGNSYSISDIESVNLSGGNVSLNIPLASLPAGRGDASGYSISLRYDSKLWDTQQEWNSDATDEFGAQANYTRNLLELSNEGGWKLLYGGYQLKVIDRTASGRREECVLGNTNYSKNSYRLRVEMDTPGGGSITFRPVGYDDIFKDGFFEVDLNGYVYHEVLGTTIEGQPYCPVTQYQSTTAGMTYYSTDGSGIRLFVPYHSTGSSDWTMYFPDGRVVEHLPADDTSIFQRVTDRNGNRTVLKGGTYNGLNGTKIEDSTGRFIFVAATSNGDTKVYQVGVAGAPLETTIKWKEYWVFRNYRAVDTATLLNIPLVKRRADILQDIQVVDEIVLPTQSGSLKYQFTYHADTTQPDPQTTNYTNGWGELASVTVPSLAKAEYEYSLPQNEVVLTTAMDIIKNSIVSKALIYDETYDGQTTQRTDTWEYSTSIGHASVTAPDGSVTTQSSFNKTPSLKESVPSDWNAGLVFKTTNADGSIVEKVWEQKGSQTPAAGQPINPYLKTEFSTVADSAGQPTLTAIKDFIYDQNMNVLEIREYDWVSYCSVRTGANCTGRATVIPSGAVLKRKTVNTYYNPTPTADVTTYGANHYTSSSSPRLRNVIKSTEIQDGSGNVKSRTEFLYDDYSNTGNLIETKVWDSTKAVLASPDSNGFRLNSSNSISTFAEYDQYGNVEEITDAKGNITRITYGSVGAVSGLYPTQTVTAYGTSVARTSSAAYDFYTGAVTASTDEDNDVTVATVYDDLGRPTIVKNASGTALESWTQTSYDDVNRRVIVRSDLETKEDARKVAVQHFDQLGRVSLSRTLENPATEDPANEQHGIKVQTRYKTENGYTYQLVSNPFRAATASGATNEPTMGWTRSKAWSTGRRSETETFSGAALPGPFGSNANSTGVVITESDAAVIQTGVGASIATVTDQAGKKRRSLTNALGHLIRVDEPDESNALGAVTSPYQPTVYTYDTLNNLLTVTQASATTTQCGGASSCTQTRSFAYSSLSRLISATNPESGTINYVYDPNGNLTTKTDARGVQTDYGYDALNRILTRNYSTTGGTPTNYQASPNVTYVYRTTAPGVGALASVSTGTGSNLSTTEYLSFDILGRVTRSKQTTDGVVYGDDANPMTYSYNLSGALIEQQYPSGRKVRNELDATGDLAVVESKKNPSHAYWTFANRFSYNAAGAVTSMQLGNGRWESTTFNSRMQPTQIALGKTQNATNLLDLDYTYGTTANNGNVLSQTITVPSVGATSGFAAVQTYTYDSLNRIKIATETLTPTTGSTETWTQEFRYDRHGNRTFHEPTTTTLPKECNNNTEVCPGVRPVVNPPADPSTNKLIGYSFDATGNTKQDAQNRKFTYDSENKQVKVETLSGDSIGEYFYDGDGKRIKKRVYDANNVVTEETIFVYDAGGKLIGEYSNEVASQPKVAYLTSDHLGSPRINTDINGNVTARHDYYPFGEEIVGSKRPAVGYADDEVRNQFTGYERDGEIGLDFAEARMYAATIGRFTSPDPENIGAIWDDPQSWAGYTYSRNNPLVLTDPNGLRYTICDPQGGNCKNYSDAEVARMKLDAGVGTFVGDFDPTTGLYRGIIEDVEGQQTAIVTQTSIDSELRQIGRGAKPTLDVWFPIIEFYGTYVLPFFAMPVTSAAPIDYLSGTTAREVIGLSAAQTDALRKLWNNINDHLTEKDIQGLIRDVSNNPVTKPNGGSFNHYKEVTEAVRGLNKSLHKLERALEKHNLDPAVRRDVNHAVQQARSVVSRVEKIIRSH